MGPLEGLKVIEFSGIGPAPMCAMLLADLGATVLRLERQQSVENGILRPLRYDLLLRNRSAISVDLKQADGVAFAIELIRSADVLIEGFRPGTMERLELGPERCLTENPALVYGRMTGWGQTGPYAKMAGHDINYISLIGALHAIGRKNGPPTPPLNLVGDFGGGALYLAFGVMAALFSVRATGKGQVIDAAMVDGAASLMTSFFGLAAAGLVSPERGTNLLDSGAPFYDTYLCADERYISVGPLEPKFRKIFLASLDIDDAPDGHDPNHWGVLRDRIARTLRTRTRDEWCEMFDGTDACVAPVLTIGEAPLHPHNMEREAFIEIDGIVQPAPAPRFSQTPPQEPRPPEGANVRFEDCLAEWGVEESRIRFWRDNSAVGRIRAGID